MTLRFTKATRDTGVDGHFTAEDPRVIVKPSEFPTPLYPEDSGFWTEFGSTIDAVCQAHDRATMRRGVAPGVEPLTGGTAQGAAEAVQSDWPTEIITAAIRALKPAPLYMRLAPLRRDFTDGVVALNAYMSRMAHLVSPSSFAAKWHYMVPRPEEVAGAIARGEIDAPQGVVIRLYDMIKQDTLVRDQRRFTMYPEGCPKHPSFSAMHSAAASAAATVAKAFLDLSVEQTAAVNLAARNMAYFRTVAGVHYPQDNRVGLWLGQEVARRTLPKMLNDELGVSLADGEAAVDAAMVKWLED